VRARDKPVTDVAGVIAREQLRLPAATA